MSRPWSRRLGGQLGRVAAHTLLRSLDGATLTLHEGGAFRRFGTPGPDRLEAAVAVADPAAFRAVLTSGSVGLGAAYRDGLWESDDLVAVIRVLQRSLGPLNRVLNPSRAVTARFLDPLRRRRTDVVDRGAARDEVRAHYDLGNDFFAGFLDPTMQYSCALYLSDEATLEAASVAKMDRLCRQLRLGVDDHLVEIGTGWGGLAVHAATTYGCRVTTTTISDRQHEHASRLVKELGLDDRVTVLADDFRDVEGSYDALVSVEMIEALDWREHDSFFAACDALVRPGGRVAIQAITLPDADFHRAKANDDFINHFIFPGGTLPSLGAIAGSVARQTSLELVDTFAMGLHYARTLREWRARFLEMRADLPALGLDERFARLWDLYLATCEALFLERQIDDVQLTYVKWS